MRGQQEAVNAFPRPLHSVLVQEDRQLVRDVLSLTINVLVKIQSISRVVLLRHARVDFWNA